MIASPTALRMKFTVLADQGLRGLPLGDGNRIGESLESPSCPWDLASAGSYRGLRDIRLRSSSSEFTRQEWSTRTLLTTSS